MNQIERLHRGLELIFKNRELIDFSDTDFNVIHKTAELSSAPAHSNSGYISIATTAEIDNHDELLIKIGWCYEYPYYCFYWN